jgi:predicted permease
MLRTLPIQDPKGLVELLFKAPGQDHFDAFDWENNHVFTGVIAASETPLAIHGEGLEPETVRVFSTLGVNAVLGRLIGPEDGSPGSLVDVAVVSWSYWQKRLHSDPAIVGRHIGSADRSLTIIGVAPRGLVGLKRANRQEIWLPLTAQQPRSATTAKYWLKLAARLKPGVSITQARAEMNVLWRWTQEEEFKANDDRTIRDWKMEVQPAGTGLSHLRDQFGKPALALMAVVALLLLIACANIASLLLARGAARRREMAVRVSLGAGRLQLLLQELTESVLLSATGGLLGILLANWGTQMLVGIMESGRLRVELQARPDLSVLAFIAGIALFCGDLFGLAPAWQTFNSLPCSFCANRRRRAKPADAGVSAGIW